MSISLARARKLCTKSEFELVESSAARNARALSTARLKQKVTIVRRLRDKYRDLAKRQRLEARGKRQASGQRPAQGQDNTERKAQLFQEVLERFESHVGKSERRDDRRTDAGSRAPGKRSTAKSASRTGAAAPTKRAAKSASKSVGKTGAKSASRTGAKSASRSGAKSASKSGAKSASKSAGKQASRSARNSPGDADGSLSGAIPARGKRAAKAVAPGKPGAAASKGARSRPMKKGAQDRSQQASSTAKHAHTRASGQRNQARRDKR